MIGDMARLWRCAAIGGLLVLAVAGCAALTAAADTDSSLQAAGYRNVGVNVQAGAGFAGADVVRVSYAIGPSGRQHQDAVEAEKIVWDTFRLRFRELVIAKTGGGCAGPVCVSKSGVIATASYGQLAAEFGPRPGHIASAGRFSLPGWAIAALIALALAVMGAVVVILTLIVRSARRPAQSGNPAS